MMASRGMVPLGPADQAAVLYQLSLDGDAGIATAARATAAGLPENLLVGVLANAALDVRVLDFFAGFIGERAAAFDAVVLNQSTDNSTIARLAAKANAREIDLIASNEQRLLRCPEIIAAMYFNKQARMSTVDRAVELAIRNNVKVEGIAAWDEICKALMGGGAKVDPAADALFANVAAACSGDDSALTKAAPAEPEGGEIQEVIETDNEGNATIEGKKVPINQLNLPAKLRLASIGNAFARSILIRDPLKLVAMAVIKSPTVTDNEVAGYARNAGLVEDVIRYIAGKRDWTKLYAVKLNLCLNPKTPLPEATRILPTLRDRDVKTIAKSRGVPSALAAQARQMITNRSGGRG